MKKNTKQQVLKHYPYNQHVARCNFIKLCLLEIAEKKKIASDKENNASLLKKEQSRKSRFTVGDYYLTNREFQCVKLMVADHTTKQTGKVLNLSHRTVEYYLKNVRSKTGCRNKSELIKYMQVWSHKSCNLEAGIEH